MMEYQTIINTLFKTALILILLAIPCFIGIGIYTHKRDKLFEKTMIEFKKGSIVVLDENNTGGMRLATPEDKEILGIIVESKNSGYITVHGKVRNIDTSNF